MNNMIKCPKCGYENRDDFYYCAKCGYQLIDNPEDCYEIRPNMGYKTYKNLIIVTYIVTILLSWGGVIIYLLGLRSSVDVLGFAGCFMPFYLLQNPDKKLRRNGYILLLISIIGIALSCYLLFYD